MKTFTFISRLLFARKNHRTGERLAQPPSRFGGPAWPILLALCAGLAARADAAQRTWTGGGTDNNWGTAANWDTGSPVNNDSVVFSGITRLQPTNNLSNLILSGMLFNASSFSLVGLSVTNNGGLVDNSGNNTNNIAQIIPVSEIISNSSALTFVNAGTLNLTNAGVNLQLSGAGPIFLNGVISGPGMLTLGNDGGSVRLGGANTFLGGVTINNNGTVVIANAGAIPNGAGRGDLTNNGTINLNGTSITVNGLYGSGTIDNLTGTATYTVTLGNNSTNSAGTFTGNIQNSFGNIALTKVTTNIFTLNGSASHTGPTTINGGTVVLGASGNLSSTPTITVTPGAVLDVSAQVSGFSLGSGQALYAGRTTNGGPSDVLGSIVSTGTINPLRPAAAGTLNVNGGLTLSGGTVNFDLATNNTIGGGANDLIVINGQLSLSGTTTIGLNPLAGSFASGTYLLISNATSLISGSSANLTADLPRGLSATFDTTTTPGSLLLTMSGTATPASLVWSAANSGDWDVRLTQNWLNGGNPDYFYNLDNVTFNDSALSGNVNLNNGVSPNSTVFSNLLTNYVISGSGAISGNGTLTVKGGGTVTLNTPNNYGGDTIVNNNSILISGVLAASPHITVYNGLSTLGNLRLAGGGFFLTDNANDTFRANFNNLILSPGAGSVSDRSSRQSGSTPWIQFNSVSRTGPGGTVDFNNIQSKSSSPQCGLFITNTTTVNSILNGFTTIFETDWVVPSATGAGSSAYGAYQTNATPSTWGANSNVALSASTAANVNTTNINSLKLVGPATVTINSGQALTLSSGGLLVPGNAAGASTITGGTLLGATNLDLIVLQHSANNALTIASVIADNPSGSALTKSGQGALILTGNNTYTGPTYINGPSINSANNNTPGRFPAGTLQIGNGGTTGSIASSSGVTNNAILAFNRSDAINFGLPISGSGALKVLAGNITLTGNNSYSGATTVSAGGTLQVGNGSTVGTLGNTVSISDNGSLIFNRSDAIAYAGVISGLGSLTQQGAGTLTLNAADSYSGNTTVSAGTLALGASGSLSNSTAISVAAAAVFDASAAGGITLNGAVGQSLAGSGTIKGNMTTTAGSSLNPAGSGTIGTLTFNNGLSLSGGTYYFDISTGSRDQLNVAGNLGLNAGLLQLNIIGSPLPNGTYKLISYSGGLSGAAANLTVAGFSQPGQVANLSDATSGEIDLVVSSYIALNLIWRGNGVNNNWDVNATADWMNGGSSSVFHNFDNANFDDTGSNTPPINLVGILSPAIVTVNAVQDYTFAGSGLIDGGASLVKNNTGNLFLLTTNSYTGTTTISGGTVQVGNGTASGDIGIGNITDNASLVFNQPDSRSVPANISGSGGLTQQGAGTLTLLGNNSYGPTTISTGVLQVGEGLNAGTLGSGPVTDNATLVLDRNGTLTVNNAIGGSGQLIVNGPGTVNLGGANSYQNNSYISNGVVRLAAAQAIPSGGTTTGWLILDGGTSTAGTLDLNGFNQNVNALAGLANTVLGSILNNGSGVGTLTINDSSDTTYSGIIADNSGAGGKVALVKTGTATQTLNVTTAGGNTYTGGTILSNGVLALATPVAAHVLQVPGVNAVGLGSGPITFYGGTLQMAGYTGDNSPTYNTSGGSWVVPSGQTGVILVPQRGELSGTFTGSGSLLLGVNYVRSTLALDASGFTGQLAISNGPAGGGARINSTIGFPGARVYLGPGITMYSIAAANSVIPFGELTGDATSVIGPGLSSDGNAHAAVWQVGMLNTTATFNGSFSSSAGIIKDGTGTWTLAGANTHSGVTAVTNGVLAFANDSAVSGNTSQFRARSATAVFDATALSGSTLNVGPSQEIGGLGTVWGSVNVSGTMQPGASGTTGIFTVTNGVTLAGETLINLNRTNSLNCGRLVATNITYGGTLTVTNVGNTLLGGDTFDLFSGALSGAFSATNLPVLAPGLSWVTTNLNANGSLSVVGQIIPPQMGPIQVSGTTNIISGTNGLAGGTYYVLTSTNVALPLARWTSFATNTFAPDGSFSFTNTAATGPQQFYDVVEILP